MNTDKSKRFAYPCVSVSIRGPITSRGLSEAEPDQDLDDAAAGVAGAGDGDVAECARRLSKTRGNGLRIDRISGRSEQKVSGVGHIQGLCAEFQALGLGNPGHFGEA